MSLSVEERAMIAFRYEVWRKVQEVQQWWYHEKGRKLNLSNLTIKKWHKRLMETGSVCDASRRRVSPSRSDENVVVVNAMFFKESRLVN